MARRLGHPLDLMLAQVAWAQGDALTETRELAAAQADVFGRFETLPTLAARALMQGEFRQWQTLADRYHALAQQVGFPASTAANNVAAQRGLAAALFGRMPLALGDAALLAKSGSADFVVAAADIYAHAGRAEEATRLLAQAEKLMPASEILRGAAAPVITAEIALHRGAAAQAVAAMETAVPFGDACLECVYERGVVLLADQQAAAAVPVLQDLAAQRANAMASGAPILLPLAQLGLARAYAAQHQIAAARTAYQNFLATMAHADPGLPLVEQTKREYAQLR